VANLGIDEKKFFPEGNRLELEDFRESLRLPKKYFLMISDLQPHKNIENFLTAYRELFRDYREKTPAFVLVGKKGLNSESITKKLQDTPFSYYFENVNNLNYLINNATALISTSLYEENNVLPLIACACSVPILVPGSPLSKEIFTEDTALFADVTDTENIYKKLKHLLEDVSIDTYLSNKGYELARKFTWKNTAKEIYEIYRELL
jgi:glycosyltransferase involved in cell wall biosynthesis